MAEASAGVKKYQRSVGWQLNSSYVEGISTFETVPELLEAYQKAVSSEGQTVKDIGISLDFQIGYRSRTARKHKALKVSSSWRLSKQSDVTYSSWPMAVCITPGDLAPQAGKGGKSHGLFLLKNPPF
ncbi:hypothetical protein FOI68_19160 [Brevibacillus sp. LEMMJ03]|uniref:hypothetical protein n=1 Tax=Brevibacillus sp. LEMMJ03 TaxID=2595056 RepID=UPI00117FCFFF|nr:hypothetical protein [Brevibacillus sp. LEMMJ03]TRY23923.1 hypothetical protein FOI68_19160 [Brevibacillus sp. LEMMJ03]